MHDYHVGLSTKQDLAALFGDVRVVVIGGAASRMRALAEGAAVALALPANTPAVTNLSENPDRFSLFKAGPLLCVSHGIGNPSVSIVLHELAKLLHYAGARDTVLLRLGTSGGLGVAPGSVAVSRRVFNGALTAGHTLLTLGQPVTHPTELDPTVAALLRACAADQGYPVVDAITLCCDDFYEGQARMDGALCEYTFEDKMEYLHRAHAAGVRNIEMESLSVAAITGRLGLRSGIVCVTLLDRLCGDQITDDHALLNSWMDRGIQVVYEFIRRVLRGELHAVAQA